MKIRMGLRCFGEDNDPAILAQIVQIPGVEDNVRSQVIENVNNHETSHRTEDDSVDFPGIVKAYHKGWNAAVEGGVTHG
ncbi:hypothetical protein GCM10010912_12600 [Paenibacillus albidus]|uniref:Uncharacterized protein n=1 Tax=Paenibacillus albidus TaxID=2041023 RepID=A0A917C2E1_9BACL|nr:hypothetical protein [Paenibacillus albidus]GGF68976.1 hypothetical protein GCM10010912_12600 [Paenibacillus albidus]